jgi:hypothetical protein
MYTYLYFTLIFYILIIVQSTNTKDDVISKYKLIKLEQQIKKLELDLEYAMVINQNINYIDDYWKNHIKIIKNIIKNNDNDNNYSNKIYFLNENYDIQIKYPNNQTQVIKKYCDIIMDIIKLNKNFTNNIITNIPIDIDTENVKKGFIKKIFYSSSNNFFNVLQQGIDKIYNIKSKFITKENNYDYEFFTPFDI